MLLNQDLDKLKSLYPKLTSSKTFFIIGINLQGGTIRNNNSIIGTEVLFNNKNFSTKKLNQLVIHEYVHTQQSKPDFNSIDVLTSCIREGSCDFLAEIITGKKINSPYMVYGKKHEKKCWELFKNEMHTQNNDNWVSTGNNPKLLVPDLGYFIGYAICKSYYEGSKNKKQAINDIINIDYKDKNAVQNFLQLSNYVKYIGK